jgi:hypothetical protein
MDSYVVTHGNLVENAVSHIALLDGVKLQADADNPARSSAANLVDYRFHIQIGTLGGATSVTVEGLGPANVWSTIASGLVAGASTHITAGAWHQIRLTWTGGAPDGNGRAGYFAARKFNGVL